MNISKSIGSFALLMGMLSDASAQHAGSAKELVAKIGFAEQVADARDRCIESAAGSDVEEQYQINPEMFEGLTPSSERWGDVRDNYLSYLRSMCDIVPPDRMTKVAEEVYADALSEEDLRSIIEFYETDAGKKYVGASIAVTRELNRLVYSDKGPEMKKIWEDYMERLRKISSDGD